MKTSHTTKQSTFKSGVHPFNLACSNILISTNISDFFSYNEGKKISFAYQEEKKMVCYYATFFRGDHWNDYILINLAKNSTKFYFITKSAELHFKMSILSNKNIQLQI